MDVTEIWCKDDKIFDWFVIGSNAVFFNTIIKFHFPYEGIF